MKQGKTGTGGEKTYARDESIETDISETGNIGTKGETRGTGTNGESVRDVTEIGADFGNGGYSRGWQSGTDLSEIQNKIKETKKEKSQDTHKQTPSLGKTPQE